jgi:uncharacterized membrane protein YfcA
VEFVLKLADKLPDRAGGVMDLSLVGALVLGRVGFLAGLLGIGGGLTMVPILTILFTQRHFPIEHVVHMAVATSTATIVFTSISSAREHHRHGAVLWPVVAAIAPGIVVGSPRSADRQWHVDAGTGVLLRDLRLGAGTQRCCSTRSQKPSRELPGKPGLFEVGGLIGLISSMVGAGGGFLSVPFMTWCNVKIRNAVATSAARLPIALAGTVGFTSPAYAHDGHAAATASATSTCRHWSRSSRRAC